MSRSGLGFGVGTGLQNFVPFVPRNLPNLQLWLDATQINPQGYSLDFDGTDDYVQADNEITDYPFTLECWVRLDVVNSNDTLISLNITTTGDLSTHYSIRYNGASNQKFAIRAMTDSPLVSQISSGTTTPMANVWYHIAGVFASATSRTLYVNGLLESTGTDSVNFTSATYQVRMGNLRVNTPTDFLDGKLSDVRIWNTARTAQQIADNYQKRLIGNESGLVGYWKLDRGTGTTVADSTSNNNTGTITGAIWDNNEPFVEAIDDNTAMRVWQDQSGNAYNAEQSTSAARPTYRTNQLNGLPAVVFDGTDDRLSLVSGALGMLRNVAGATVFAVVKYSASGVLMRSIFISNNIGTGQSRLTIGILPDNKIQIGGRRLDANSFESADSANAISNIFLMHSGILDYANAKAFQYRNGTLDGTDDPFQTAGNTSDTNSVYITIGANDTNQLLNGSIAEIIVYNRALNTSELAQVHKYLSMKWGIALA